MRVTATNAGDSIAAVASGKGHSKNASQEEEQTSEDQIGRAHV